MSGVALRTGVDMVSVDRVSRMIELSGDAYLETAWTAAEQAYCAGRPDRLATRWAAKEATMKALGQGVGVISPLDVEIRAGEGEPPTLLLHGSAAALAESLSLRTWSLSLTHEDHWAVAFVVAVGSTNDD
ncbi:MAG: holo-ACP synthase [Streptosporangiaceae bacterium]